MHLGKFLGGLQRRIQWVYAAPQFAAEFKEDVTNRVNLRGMHPIGALNMVAYLEADPLPCLLAGRHAVAIGATGFAHTERKRRHQQIARLL